VNVAELERLIATGTAWALRASLFSAPTLDRCLPGMVDADERAALRKARFDLTDAYMAAGRAQSCFRQAAVLIADFLEPVSRAPEGDQS
jgi:hypothetical protein